MKVTLLGTGTSQGVPVIACECEVCLSKNPRDKRLRCSVLIETESTTVIIDAGPDFREQCLRAGVNKLDALVFTHEHRDHVAGLDDVRPFNFKQSKDMPIYCHPRVAEALRIQFPYIFADTQYPGIPKIEIRPIDIKDFTIGDLVFKPIQTLHHKLPVLGFRVGDFCYITDTNYISPEEIDKVRGTQILVLDALHHSEHISHYNLAQSITVAQDIDAAQTYFTHVSHHMGLYNEINDQLPQKMALSHDGLFFEI
jgi:phosphoribosyl 1,2-cyclic phosphate phosphodiesterase